jgi:hypothetical protein
MKPILLVTSVITLLPSVMADCCKAGLLCDPYPKKCCSDGTKPTPCCGYGGCNIFCCACSGGCRKRSQFNSEQDCMTEAEHSDSAKATFMEADKKGAGYITFGQYLEYMKVEEDYIVWLEWFIE